MSLQSIADLCNHPIIVIGGTISFIASLVIILTLVASWALGIIPPVIRLGLGLWKRKIAVFSSVENYRGLKECLLDSKLFRECNLMNLGTDNLDKGKVASLLLVDWESTKSAINSILDIREHDQIPVIIYAKPGSIPNEVMADIGNRSNTVVVNFRGRLLNDVVTSLITTA